MATLALQPLRTYKARAGNSVEFDQITVSGTVIPGDLLCKTNGQAVTVAGYTYPPTITYVAVCNNSDTIPGLSNINNVEIIRPGDVFEISAHHSTAASAVVADADLDGLASYGILKTTVSGNVAWTLDLQDTTNTRVRLLGRLSTATDLYPRVLVSFLTAALTYTD